MSLFSSAYSNLRDLPSDVRDFGQNVRDAFRTPTPTPFSSVAGPRAKALAAGATPYSAVTPPAGDDGYAALLKQFQTQGDQYAAALAAASRPVAPPALPTLPKFDIADTFNRARTAAESAVSPYYEKQLQLFQDQQAQKRTQAAQDFATLQGNVADQYKNLTEGNDITRGRTAADAATNEANIGQASQNFQTNNANSFNQAFNALRTNQANSGTTFSGLGGQQAENALATNANQRDQQAGAFANQRAQQETMKTRTFADLARSEELQKQAGAKTTAAGQVDLDRTYQGLANDLINEQRSNAQQKEQAVNSNAVSQGQNLYTQFLSKLRSPEQVAYANQLYGGIF